jgi:hypothetical protein
VCDRSVRLRSNTISRVNTSSPEYWSVLSPFLGESEIKHFLDSPYCVALFPHTRIGLPYLQVWDFRMCFVLSHIWNAVDSLTSNPVSQKLVLVDTAHSSTEVTICWPFHQSNNNPQTFLHKTAPTYATEIAPYQPLKLHKKVKFSLCLTN